ncbi:hypothetical protein [Labrenzia sp. 011]|uniref:hypothetical protein n=1 Tax=Labrenzia sp. 011 TaxID=2171494 RepID=UPI000D50DE07|nr:hypothetical protein [Labrenzia sp. 011]PVB61637.1 hypothetical protein DCO57_10660 [Labrenzia sp. 011]
MSTGPSPRDQVVSKLDEEVAAGEITSEDQDAMLEALDAIHAERMESGAPDRTSEPPSKEEMQAGFESMLTEQVEAGTLDQEQADQLADLFESGELGGPAKDGPPPPPPPSGEAQQDSDSIESLMSTLLETLQSDTGYDGSGEQSASGLTSILADFTV